MNNNVRILQRHHVEPDSLRTYYQEVGEERFYCTNDDGQHPGVWFTASRYCGIWEPRFLCKAGLTMVVTDDAGNEIDRQITVTLDSHSLENVAASECMVPSMKALKTGGAHIETH